MNIYDKLSSETLLQSYADPTIQENLSSKLKDKFKVLGVAAVATILMATASGVQAENVATRNTMLGISAITGVVTSGSTNVAGKPADCVVEGKSGWKIGGAAAAGTIIGNQMGKGTGNKIMTVLGGVLGGTVANASEEVRMDQACENYKAQQARNLPQGVPSYAVRTSYSEYAIMYKAETENGEYYYVTEKHSPGLQVLRSKDAIGGEIMSSEPMVEAAIKQTTGELMRSYQRLESAIEHYKEVVYGTDAQKAKKMVKYSVNPTDGTDALNRYKEQVMKKATAVENIHNAIADYTGTRSITVKILDSAVTDGYDISPIRAVGYGNKTMANFFSFPESLNGLSQDLFQSNVLPNHFSTVDKLNRVVKR